MGKMMIGRWTLFDGTSIGARRRQIRVSLGKQKDFYINGRAHQALGEPAAVELLFDEELKKIGMRKCDPAQPNAFHLVRKRESNHYQLSAATFCNRFAIRVHAAIAFERAYVDDNGILVLDLKTAVAARRAE